MELLLPCVLVLTIFSVCFRETDGNTVTLTPSPIAMVTEGETLILQCNYSGSFSLITVNWYLNSETSGLALVASDCSYQSVPSVYETGRYIKTCSTPSFSLSIKNVTKDKDDGDIWACDTTPIGSTLPPKVSTVIKVLEQTTVSTQSSTRTATTITMTTRTRTISTTNTEMGTTQNIMMTSSCTLPVMPPVIVIIGISVSAFLFILLIIIICCCCQCCWLYHCLYRCRNEAEPEETNDNQDDKMYMTAKDVTLKPEYVLSNAPGESSTLGKFKQALSLKSDSVLERNEGSESELKKENFSYAADQTSISNQDWRDTHVANNSEVKESKHGKTEAFTNL